MAARDAITEWTDENFFPPEGDEDAPEFNIGQYRRHRAKTARKRVKESKKSRKERAERSERTAKLRGQTEERLRTTAEGQQRSREAREAGTRERFERQQRYRVEQAQYRRERDAQRQAYREAQDQAREERRNAPEPLRYEGPTFSSGGTGVVPSGGGWAPNKETVATFIIFATAIGAIAGVANDLSAHSQPITLPGGVKAPAHLRALGAAFLAGTVALLVNEVWPAGGAVLGAGIVGLIVLPNLGPLVDKLNKSALLGPQKPQTIPRSLPGNQALPPSASFPGGGAYGNLNG